MLNGFKRWCYNASKKGLPNGDSYDIEIRANLFFRLILLWFIAILNMSLGWLINGLPFGDDFIIFQALWSYFLLGAWSLAILGIPSYIISLIAQKLFGKYREQAYWYSVILLLIIVNRDFFLLLF